MAGGVNFVTMNINDMDPKEKAIELKLKFGDKAILVVEEILHDDVYDLPDSSFDIRMDYWLNVKNELEKL
jgi:hypothetical protein